MVTESGPGVPSRPGLPGGLKWVCGASPVTKVGLQRLVEDLPESLKGARVGLLAHRASVARVGGEPRHAVDLVAAHPDLTLERLFGPEHGLYGDAQAGERVVDGVDARTGLKVVSLYGARRAPAAEHLRDLDALLVDLQDVGVRCYTYLSTLKACLQACAAASTRLVVLERPNPLGRGVRGEGVAAGFASFVGAHDVPFVHGRTLGELALRMAEDLGLEPPLVVPVTGWRGESWSETGLPWLPPSPNLPTFESARCYAATVFFEGTNLSEGRGSDRPFEQVGAPWLDAHLLAETLNSQALSGVRFEPVDFTPSFSKHAGAEVYGVELVLQDGVQGEGFDPLETALTLLRAVYEQAPEPFRWLTAPDGRFFTDLLYGSSRLRTRVTGETGF